MSRLGKDVPAVAPCLRCGNLTANLSRECRRCLFEQDRGTARDPRWRTEQAQPRLKGEGRAGTNGKPKSPEYLDKLCERTRQ